jgi:hypothetical protein
MPLTLAERALCIIESRLAGIARLDGYATDAGLRVFRARRTLDERDIPAVVLWDDGETVADGGSGNTASMSIGLTFSIDAHVPADQDCTGRELERVKGDVKRGVLAARGALIDDLGAIGVITYTGCDTQARSDGAASEAVSLHFTANYKEAFGDPTSSR